MAPDYSRPVARPFPHDGDVLPSDAPLHGALLDAMGEAVVATDSRGRILYWNDAAARLYGWTADEVIGSTILEVTPAIAEQARSVLERVRRGAGWSGELLVRHRDGHAFPVLITASAVRDAGGRVSAIVGVSRDVTRRRAAERSARNAEERLELVGRAAATSLREWDLESGALQWSGATGDAFGYGPDDIEPTWEWWTSRIHPEDRARVADGFRRLLEDGDTTFWTDEYRFLTRDRGYATVFDRAYVSRNGAGAAVRVAGTMTDVTDRRRLHEGQRFLSQSSMILDLSLDYEATLPTIARLTAHALADCCILHAAPGEGFGGFDAAAHIDPRLQTAVEDAASFLAAGVPVGSVVERVLRDGESVLVRSITGDMLPDRVADPGLREVVDRLGPRSALFVPLRARRAVLGFAILVRCTDDRPYDEDDLHLAEELGRRIGLAIDHSRLFQSAELANRAKSDFLAVISHELRTPLTAVLGYADLLGDQISGPLNETQVRQVDRIRAGSQRLLRLIEGILTFARLEAGSERAQFETVHLPALIHRAEEIVAPRALEKPVGFEVVIEDIPATIRTDPERCVQVLLSLLSNAIKFTGEGSVRLRAHRGDDLLFLDVSDSGSGIAPEHLPYVFNPFWQAEQPATRRAGGAGLGLSVARRLARLLKGDVLVTESTPAGTTFRFQLPIRPRA